MLIKHKTENAWVYYSEKGITIKPFFYWNSFDISWEEIEFFSLIPSVEYTEKIWQTYHKKNLMGDDAIKKLDLLIFDIVIKDFHKLTYGKNVIEKVLGYCFFPMWKRLFVDDNKLDPKQASISYKFNGGLNVPLRELLDLIQEKNQFNLLCHFD